MIRSRRSLRTGAPRLNPLRIMMLSKPYRKSVAPGPSDIEPGQDLNLGSRATRWVQGGGLGPRWGARGQPLLRGR